MPDFRSFAINGRFLSQPVTGVQRYAINVTQAIGEMAAASGSRVPLLAPTNAIDPNFDGTRLDVIGCARGHAWEQLTLPRAWSGHLLNFCNTAPALKHDQVVCIHDANVFLEPESYGASFRFFYKTLQPLLARRAAKIATVSAFSATQLARHLSIDASEIVVLPNGHEHVRLWDSSQASRAPTALRRYPDGANRPFILALGSRARHKNLSLLLGLADELAALNIDLVVAGGQSNIFASEKLQRGENVQFLGAVTDHDLAYLFERALCLAFPSLTEGFGLPALEAMALGCPVISTDRASLPEICGNAALLAPPDQPRSWIEHVRTLMDNPSLREELIERGRKQAALFSWKNTAEGYLDLIGSPQKRAITREIGLPPLPKVAVVIATLGRPSVVSETMRRILDLQTYKPAAAIISCITLDDAGEAAARPDVMVLTGRPGLATQRNTALAALPDDIDIVVFFDDDFVPKYDWLGIAVRVFQREADVIGFTGGVIADGIKGPGLSFAETDRLIDQAGSVEKPLLIEPYRPYGCNMAFRRSAIQDVRFDERLVLYGWLEDRDFGAALAARGGRLIKCTDAQGVHMGVKSGRIAGDRLGYSQVVNPLYMFNKGTMNRRQITDHLFRNIFSNLVHSAFPEPFIDRRGRLRGNIRGIIDVLRGRLEPERALEIRGKAAQMKAGR